MKRIVSLLLSFALAPWSFSLSGCSAAPEEAKGSTSDHLSRDDKKANKDSYCVAGKPCCFVNWGGSKIENGKTTYTGYWDSTDAIVSDWAEAKDCSAPPVKWCCTAKADGQGCTFDDPDFVGKAKTFANIDKWTRVGDEATISPSLTAASCSASMDACSDGKDGGLATCGAGAEAKKITSMSGTLLAALSVSVGAKVGGEAGFNVPGIAGAKVSTEVSTSVTATGAVSTTITGQREDTWRGNFQRKVGACDCLNATIQFDPQAVKTTYEAGLDTWIAIVDPQGQIVSQAICDRKATGGGTVSVVGESYGPGHVVDATAAKGCGDGPGFCSPKGAACMAAPGSGFAPSKAMSFGGEDGDETTCDGTTSCEVKCPFGCADQLDVDGLDGTEAPVAADWVN
jgi:hypothetical protein